MFCREGWTTSFGATLSHQISLIVLRYNDDVATSCVLDVIYSPVFFILIWYGSWTLI